MPRRSGEQRIQELLDALRIGLDLDLAFVGEFDQGKRTFRFVAGRLPAMEIEPGMSDPLEESYCHWIVQGRMPEVIQDAREEPTAGALATTEPAGIRSHIGIPLRMSDGRLFGTLCAAGTTRRPDLDERTLDYVRNIAAVIARELEEVLESERDLDKRLGEIGRLLEAQSFEIHLQPIVNLTSGQIVSLEALTRFDTDPYRPPNEWFTQARTVGLGTELELAAARKAATYIADLDPAVSLSVNVSPATVLAPEFLEGFAAYGGRLIVEVTEHDAIEDYQKILAAVEPLTDRGIRLAVDDVGAGHASLAHILELAPDVVKLDVTLTKEIDRDLARHAMVAALVTFTDRVDARLVAEGIETEAAQDVLQALGVRFGQGYLLARPAPADDAIRDLGAHGWCIAT